MKDVSIFKVDHNNLSAAIKSFTADSRWGDEPDFLVMSVETLGLLIRDAKFGFLANSLLFNQNARSLDYEAEYMGIPIALNNSLELGQVKVV